MQRPSSIDKKMKYEEYTQCTLCKDTILVQLSIFPQGWFHQIGEEEWEIYNTETLCLGCAWSNNLATDKITGY